MIRLGLGVDVGVSVPVDVYDTVGEGVRVGLGVAVWGRRGLVLVGFCEGADAFEHAVKMITRRSRLSESKIFRMGHS